MKRFALLGAISTLAETFKAGQGTFGLIEEPKAFPQALPAVQVVARQVDALKEGTGTTSKSESSDSGGTALIVAIVSLIVGGAGLATGIYGLSKRDA